MTNLVTLLAATVAAHGENVAVRHDDDTLTYAELDDASARVAALLRDRGLLPGDRVALTMPNVPLFPVLYYGILRAGGVVVPMNPLLKAREVAFTLRDCGARVALVSPLFADEVTKAAAETGTDCLVTGSGDFDTLLRGHEPLRETPDRADDDPALILYTSGTTGTPKGAELSHRNLASNTLTTAETLLQVGPDDVLFGGLPSSTPSARPARSTWPSRPEPH